MGGIGSGGFRENSGRKCADGLAPQIRISVSLPSSLADRVQSRRVATGKPVSRIVAELIEKHL